MNVCVLGQGYVGLTLSLVLAEKGHKVLGIDKSKSIISSLKKAKSPISEKSVDSLLKKHLGKNFVVSENIHDEHDVFVTSVGTPLEQNKIPNMEHVKQACEEIGSYIKKGNLLVLRSTVPVGTTRNIAVPVIEKKSGLKAGEDFDVVFAGERTIEGNAIAELQTNPQIIGGISEKSTNAAKKLFETITKTIIPVSNIETAELTKLIDNTYRDVHFAYSNEIALICECLKIDAKECIEAANHDYPRNKIPVPSPGVGGPCLSKDPYIIAHSVKPFGFQPEVIMKSRWINEYIPIHLANKITKKLNDIKPNENETKIFVIGFAYKGNPETNDTRDSPTLTIVNELKKHKFNIFGFDPLLSADEISKFGVTPSSIENGFEKADCVVIVNNHKSYLEMNIDKLISKTTKPCLFVDCWNQFRSVESKEGIIYTGVGID